MLKKRVYVVYSLLCAFFLLVLVLIYRLSTGNILEVAGSKNGYSVSVATVRGTIYDRHLMPLVNDRKQYKAAFVPNGNLLPLLRTSMDDIAYERLLDKWQGKMPLVVNLDKPVAPTAGLRQFLVPLRYGNRLVAPHLLGYLDGSGKEGVTGLEASYNTLLQQYSGEIRVAFGVDGSGGYLQGVEPSVNDTSERSAGGLILTLDKDVQTAVEDIAAEQLKKGAAIVVNLEDHSVLAAVSCPTFQPSTVADSLESEDAPLLNRLLSRYDCGSVFKIVTAAAALESGILPKKVYTCAGALQVGSSVFHCHHRLGHQELSMEQAMAVSCNLYFIQLARDIGGVAVYRMAESMGLLASLSLAQDIGAPAAVVPTLAEMEQSPSVLANLSFGQGKLLVSPLHIAAVTATVADNGIMTPFSLIYGTTDEKKQLTVAQQGRGERVISEETAQTLQRMLRGVVEHGTGLSAKPNGTTAAGKTGTAETGQYTDGKPVVQGWFTGYFPAESPQYVITVLAEDAQNYGSSATEVFREIAEYLQENI